MINFLGKLLAVVFTACSLIALALAVAVYSNFPDLGWIDPRRVVVDTETRDGAVVFKYGRIASLFDKTAVGLQDAYHAAAAASAPIEEHLKTLRKTEQRLHMNHLAYHGLIEAMRGAGPNDPDIQVQALADGVNNLDMPVIGMPKLGAKVDEISKSYKASEEVLRTIQKQIADVNVKIGQSNLEAEKITFQMTGRDDKGQLVMKGLYDLVNDEYKKQELIKEEFEYLKPHWAQAIEEARLFTQRRVGLERTLQRLKDAPGAKSP